MDQNMRLNIAKTANIVRSICGVTQKDVDVEEVVKNLRGKIVKDPNCTIDGYVTRSTEPNFKFTIFVPEVQIEERKKFTIAHEIGHLFLHMGYLVDEEKFEKFSGTLNRDGDTEQENEAHEFAAAFLMPEREFKECVEFHSSNNVVDVRLIANEFKVSISAAITRGKWLGVFAW